MKSSNLNLKMRGYCSRYIRNIYLVTLFYLFLLFNPNITCNNKMFQSNQLDFQTYHTTEIIDKSIKDLMLKCPGLIIEKTAEQFYKQLNNQKSYSPYLKFYDITSQLNLNNKKDNIFLLAGEHPREMISAETMFTFIKYLCEKKDTSAKRLLETNNFRIIVNANPNGRIQVEKGDYCKRTNLNDVDINRNWDYFFGKEITLFEENSGKSAFSEIETTFIRDAIKEFNAKLFLSMHSGTLALFHPYAYLSEEGKFNADKMKEVLGLIKKKFCSNCDLGAPSKLIGYKSSGTCLDFIYDNLKVPYSLAWEIYTNEKEIPELNNYLVKKQQNNQNVPLVKNQVMNPTRFRQINLAKEIDQIIKRRKEMKINDSFLETEKEEIKYEQVTYFRKNSENSLNQNSSGVLSKSGNIATNLFMTKRGYSDNEKKICLNLFNPPNRDSYDFVINNWTMAMINLIEYVNKN